MSLPSVAITRTLLNGKNCKCNIVEPPIEIVKAGVEQQWRDVVVESIKDYCATVHPARRKQFLIIPVVIAFNALAILLTFVGLLPVAFTFVPFAVSVFLVLYVARWFKCIDQGYGRRVTERCTLVNNQPHVSASGVQFGYGFDRVNLKRYQPAIHYVNIQYPIKNVNASNAMKY